MFWRFLVLLLVYFESHSQNVISGYVLDNKKDIIVGVSVFFRNYSSLGTTTDQHGFFTINPPQNATHLVFSCVGYEELEVNLVTSNYSNKGLNIVLKESNTLLNEVAIRPKKISVTDILYCIDKAFKKNYQSNQSSFELTGLHIATENQDTLIAINSPYILTFWGYPSNDRQLTNIFSQKEVKSILKKGKTTRVIPYYSEIFLLKWFRWVYLPDISFVANPNEYEYTILEEEDSYLILFKPQKTSKNFRYFGSILVDKNTCAVIELKAKLSFDKNNVDKVISTQKKYPSVQYYYETQEIDILFDRNEESQLYELKKIMAYAVISRAVDKTQEKVLYRVKTDLNFNSSEMIYGRNDVRLIDVIYIDSEKKEK
jgi:CarboxypepD_reg-like domain